MRLLPCDCAFHRGCIQDKWDGHCDRATFSREVSCPSCAKSWKVLELPNWDNVMLYRSQCNRYRTFPKWLDYVKTRKDRHEEGSEPGSDDDWYSDSTDEEWK